MQGIGDRMKENYENRSRYKLTRRMPVIMRLDGKAFHTVTKGCDKPFDEFLNRCMVETSKYLLKNIQGSKLVYTQSDEISILLTDFDQLNTDAWFDYNIQKMTSVSAGYASAFFTQMWKTGNVIVFDSRVFNIPKEEVCNYFIWRQLDWERNSIQMLSQANFSHKQLHKKSNSDMHEMLHEKGINWAKLEDKWKNGTTISKAGREVHEHHDYIFSKDREFVEKYLVNGE
jgi:tRNA(His) 5'-end guanylyltransferase